MLEENKILEEIGELLRGNIRYDLEASLDRFEFFKTKNKKDNLFKGKIDKRLQKKITLNDNL